MPNGISVLASRPVLNKGEVSTKAAMASAVRGVCAALLVLASLRTVVVGCCLHIWSRHGDDMQSLDHGKGHNDVAIPRVKRVLLSVLLVLTVLLVILV